MSQQNLSAADREAVQARIDDTWAALLADPDNPEKALRALSAHARLHDVTGFRKLAEFLEPRTESHPGILAGLIYIHRELRELGEVTRLLERAKQAKPGDEEWHEGFARIVMDYGYREEAWPHLEHIVTRGIPDQVGLILGLAQMHQAAGEHPAALRHFANAETLDPRLAEAEEFQALVQASRAAGTFKTRVDSGQVLLQLRQKKQLGRAMRVVPAILALFVAAYAAVAWARSFSRTVWLVNGLSAKYRVSVGAAMVELSPGQATEVQVAEGPLEVRADGLASALGTQNVTLNTPFWSRPFSRAVHVINPDRCAPLGRYHVVYSSDASAHEPRCDWSAGQLLYTFRDVDDPFRRPPDQLTVSDGSRGRVRVVLMPTSLERAEDRGQLGALRRAVGDAEYLALLARWLKLEGIDAGTSEVLRAACSPQEVVALVEPGLDARPANLEHHRTYADAMEEAGRGAEVAKLYADLSAREPQDSGFAYLAARAQEDPDVWLTALERLAREPKAPAMVQRSLAMAYVQRGRFAEAVGPARAYAEGPPARVDGEMFYWSVLNGAGRSGEALQRIEHDKVTDPNQNLFGRCLFLAASGREAEGKALLKKRAGDMPFEQSERLTAQLETLMAIAAGRYEEAGRAMQGSHEPRQKALAALLMGNPRIAATVLGKDAAPADALAIFLTFHRQAKAGDPLARQALERAIEGMKTRHGSGGRAAATVLAGGVVPAERLVKLYAPLEMKAAMLAVLGLLRPADRAVYFDMARKVNQRGHYPYHLVQAVIGP